MFLQEALIQKPVFMWETCRNLIFPLPDQGQISTELVSKEVFAKFYLKIFHQSQPSLIKGCVYFTNSQGHLFIPTEHLSVTWFPEAKFKQTGQQTHANLTHTQKRPDTASTFLMQIQDRS